MAPLRDYVDLFDSTAQQIRDNATRIKLDDGGYEWRHTIITGTLTHTWIHTRRHEWRHTIITGTLRHTQTD